jgi:hypothetical protein
MKRPTRVITAIAASALARSAVGADRPDAGGHFHHVLGRATDAGMAGPRLARMTVEF